MFNNLTDYGGSGFELTDAEGSASEPDFFTVEETTVSFFDITTASNTSMTWNGTNKATNSQELQESFRYLGIVIGIIVIIVGTFGNCLTIMAFIKNRKLRRNVFNLFIVNLSVIDLLTASCMMPFNVAAYFYMEWPFGNDHVTCSLQAFFYFCCGYTSVVCLLAITMNRFVGIVFPDRYVRLYSSKWLYVILLASWTVAPAFLFPSMVKSVINNSKGIFHTPTGWNQAQFLCTFVHVEAYWTPYMQTVRILFQFLPLVLMVAAYVMIWFKVHESNARLRENAGSKKYREKIESARHAENTQLNNSPCLQLNGPGTEHELKTMLPTRDAENNRVYRNESKIISSNPKKQSRLKKIVNICKNEEEQRTTIPLRRGSTMRNERTESVGENQRKHKEQRLIYVSVIIWLTFTILFMPSLVINLLRGAVEPLDPRIHMAASNVTWFNSCVNPIIYVALHRRMRNEYKKIVKRCFNSLFSMDNH